jgi:hypothetical protein
MTKKTSGDSQITVDAPITASGRGPWGSLCQPSTST